MAEKLKGLFVLFAGYLIKNTATILDSTNITKTGTYVFTLYNMQHKRKKSHNVHFSFLLQNKYSLQVNMETAKQ
jgi:hypothetical protein